jgi:hypothetical protein
MESTNYWQLPESADLSPKLAGRAATEPGSDKRLRSWEYSVETGGVALVGCVCLEWAQIYLAIAFKSVRSLQRTVKERSVDVVLRTLITRARSKAS